MSCHLKKPRPLHNEQPCPGCDGAGVTQSEDYDEHGRHVPVECEQCMGAGKLVDCNRCDEPTPPAVLETSGGYCVSCVVEMSVEDAAAEQARVRRAS